jgi:hypothetical protein
MNDPYANIDAAITKLSKLIDDLPDIAKLQGSHSRLRAAAKAYLAQASRFRRSELQAAILAAEELASGNPDR